MNPAFAKGPPVYRFFLKAGFSAAVFMLMMGILEIILRLTKEPPWQPDLVPFRVEPGGKLYEDDPLLGYRLKPGCFDVSMANGYHVTTTHLGEHERATGSAAPAPGLPEIWIFGCSYTYGWSLRDEESYPWRVQTAMPRFHVRNFGVPGYNDVQSLLWMRQKIRDGSRPQIVVLAYASFHDERNAGLRKWQKTLIRSSNGGLGPQGQPYARLDTAGRLWISEQPAKLREFPGMRTFSIPHSIEKRWNKIEAHAVPTAGISRQLIQTMAAEVRAAGGSFLLAGMEDDPATRQMLERWETDGGQAVDLSVDLNQAEFRNLPHDPHPSPLANRHFGAKLSSFLRSHSSVK